uniref:Palmitoyltransferase n=1 Tax=Macrostomum lignano TaxID=282301 RepID=A0A1I8FH22_9PLAT
MRGCNCRRFHLDVGRCLPSVGSDRSPFLSRPFFSAVFNRRSASAFAGPPGGGPRILLAPLEAEVSAERFPLGWNGLAARTALDNKNILNCLSFDQFKLSQTDLANIQIVEGNESESSSRRQDYLLGVIAERHLPVYTRGSGGSNGGNSGSTSQGRFIRLCDPCQLIKPDRAHHCSTCGVSRLSLHERTFAHSMQLSTKNGPPLSLVNNCVGLHNYKYFLLFLVYGALYCFYVGGSSANSRAPILESGPDYRAFDLGFKRNFRQVFGNRWQLWPLPVKS